jgi:hypothetical protein
MYGENEAEYGNPIGDTTSAQRDWSYFTSANKAQIYLGGTSVQSLYDDFGLEEQDLLPYLPADPAQMQRKQVAGALPGLLPQVAPAELLLLRGRTRRLRGLARTHARHLQQVQQHRRPHRRLPLLQRPSRSSAIASATYDAAQEIRSRDITRDEGVALVRRYDGEFPERFAEEIFRYLSIPEKEFGKASRMFESPHHGPRLLHALADSFRSPHLWKRENGQWKLRHTVFDGV